MMARLSMIKSCGTCKLPTGRSQASTPAPITEGNWKMEPETVMRAPPKGELASGSCRVRAKVLIT